jgi:hypothetical protein
MQVKVSAFKRVQRVHRASAYKSNARDIGHRQIRMRACEGVQRVHSVGC